MVFLAGRSFGHEKCSLGRWYAAVGRARFADLPAIRTLEGPHRELHQTIQRVVELKRRGDDAGAEREYRRIAPLSDQIISLIEQIEQQL